MTVATDLDADAAEPASPGAHAASGVVDEPAPTREDRLRDRLLGPGWRLSPSERLWGWLGPLIVMAIGGGIRFWGLGWPPKLVFDETYYVKQAASLLKYGVEMRVVTTFDPDEQKNITKVNEAFAAGDWNVFDPKNGDLVVHPPVGKWVIAVGEWLFGPSSHVGWRFSVALLGTLSILLVGRAAMRMFRSAGLATMASFLIAFEGFHLVLSRVAILDMIVSFFVLAAFVALLADRDRSRMLLARRVGALPDGTHPQGFGPSMGWRPWLWVSGVCLGLATGTKLSGLIVMAAFGLMVVWWDMGARRAAGVRNFMGAAVVRDGPVDAVALLAPAFAVYAASWTGWFVTDIGYHRRWDFYNPGQGIQWLPSVLRNWVKYHQDMYSSAASIVSEHSYMSNPWGWIVQARPTSMYYEGPKLGEQGCAVESCSSAITPIGNIAFWWVGVLALVVCVWLWAVRRDWRAGALLAGVAAVWGPWFLYQQRTVFSFYAVAFEPFVALAIVLCIGLWLGRSSDAARRRVRVWVVAGYLLLVLGIFAFFWAVQTGQVIPYPQWQWRMWFPSWV